MTFTFDDKNTFRNVGIGTTNNKIIIMNVSKSTDNLSFHSTTNDTSVDIMNIKTLLNKHQNKELHLSAYDGSTINPIIKINNTHQHVNIMSNLNVASNLNVTGSTTLSDTLNVTGNTILKNHTTIGHTSGNTVYENTNNHSLYFGTSHDAYRIGPKHDGTQYNNLDIKWYSGIRMGAHYTAGSPSTDGGLKIYHVQNSSPYNFSDINLLFSVGKDDDNTIVEKGNLLIKNGGLRSGTGRNIAGYLQATPKVVLGNSNDNTEVSGDKIEITGGVATAGSSNVPGCGGFSKRLYLYNRGLYLFQNPWGSEGSSSVGRGSWLITPGFQKFRLEFLITSTTGSLEILSHIDGNGVYGVGYSFTGQHKSKSINDTIYDNIEDYVGLICYATGEYATYDFDNETCNSDSEGITINDSMPIIDLCNTKKDKRVYGVISNKEDTDREMGYGRFVSKLPSANDANRVIVNGIGEGAIWIVNTNGNFENGDYIQTSNVAGYGEKQDDDLLHNYTVAKITCDCDFNMSSTKYESKMVGSNIACFVGCVYYCG